jgi:hypothetical protein
MKKLHEFRDTTGEYTGDVDVDTSADIGNDSDSTFRSRTSRSDEGILSLTNAVFQHVLGLKDETRSRILKIIRNQGQWQDLKVSIRQLSGVAHRRLNDVINMAQDANPATRPENDTTGKGFNPQHEPGAYDSEGHGHQRDAGSRFEFEEVRENTGSFAEYLLSEVTYDDEDLRDPSQKQDIMRMMRAGDSQADQLVNRADREQKQDRRQEIAKEQDPQRAQLLRKRQNLMQQINRIDLQLKQGTGNEQQQPQQGRM